jgi:hypothetical protein
MAYTSIDDPSAHFQTTLYTGNGADNHAITNDGNSDLQPDWVWIKYRPAGVSHVTYDSSRGATKRLYVDFASTEATQAAGVKSFDSDGFTLGTAGASNGSGITFVSWQWHANSGTTSSNSSGSITSTVQANTDAGFSIVQYTGTGSAATIGHGLGKAPAWIIVKSRTTSSNWTVRHHKTTNNYDFLSLNESNAATANDSAWTQTDPTTSVFSIGTATAVNQSTIGYIAYCFAEKQGYSKFGKYTGNGNANGTFVYTGFKPAFVMTKSTGTGSWSMYDNKRLGYNPIDVWLRANGSDAEGANVISGDDIDLYSNGFKLRNSDNTINASGTTYIYMAFAENPFVTSTGIPTTAR